MVLHLVLYRPRRDLDAAARKAFLAALERAARIPSVLRLTIGRRAAVSDYGISDLPHVPFLAIFEFQDRAGLDSYLRHPLHGELGRLFGTHAELALAYDFESTTTEELAEAPLD